MTAPASPRNSTITNLGTHHEAFEARDWTQLMFAGLVWGASFIFIAEGLESFSPGAVTFLRIAIGALTLGLLPSVRAVRIDRHDWPRVLLVAITWLALPMTLFPLAQQHISSGLAGMLNGSIPLFAALAASVVLWRLPGRNQLMGLAVGAVGIVLLGLPALGDGSSSALGVVLVVVACALYGIAVTINVPLAQKYGSTSVFWRAQCVAALLTAPYGVWGLAQGSSWDSTSAGAIVMLGVFGTAMAFVAMVALSARVGGTRAAALTYLEAIVALVLGVLVRGEPLRTLEVLGCAILLAGAWLISRRAAPT